jgi:hypothetical protein
MPGQLNAYSVADATLNMLVHKCAATLKYDGVATAAINSGRSQTSLGEGIDKWMANYAPHGLHFPLEVAADDVVEFSHSGEDGCVFTNLFW